MIDILMPRLSDTMTEGAIAAWHKQPGDPVRAGELLVEIETDKALMEQESYDDGILAEILVPAGENVAIGTPIARLDDGSDAAPGSAGPGAEPDAEPDAEPSAEPSAEPGTEPAPVAAARAAAGRPERRAATPLVRRLARERGIDLATVTGTGPGGRIVRADLDAVAGTATDARIVADAAGGAGIAAPGSTATADAPAGSAGARAGARTSSPDPRAPRAVPFDGIRQRIAERLTAVATTVPAFTATASADVGELFELRARINTASAETGSRVSVNDLVVRAVALALRAHPGVNASYSPEGRGQTLLHDRVHIGIAVASPAGLVVPVIRDADRLAVSAIAATARDLAARAADRRLDAAEMSGGTFTVSNLGMFGVDEFTAIINSPEGAILAVGAARDELVLQDGGPVSRPRLRFTITADHRIIDGALAAQFLATLVELLEHPLRIVA